MNRYCTNNKEDVTLTYFTGFLGHHRNYLYVYYLCRVLTYGHLICIIGSSHTYVPTDRFTPSWPTFQGRSGQHTKIRFWINQGGAYCNHCTQRLNVQRSTNEPLLRTNLVWPSLRVKIARQKSAVGANRHFQASRAEEVHHACFISRCIFCSSLPLYLRCSDKKKISSKMQHTILRWCSWVLTPSTYNSLFRDYCDGGI